MTKRAPRGPYAKTTAKRAEILRAAYRAYAESTSQAPTLKVIAEAVGLSEAGLLHHFASRDELLVAVLEWRDQVAGDFEFEDLDSVFAFWSEITRTPGLVRLFMEQSAASADPDHPAAHFMRRHGELTRAAIKSFLGADADWEARIFQAASDGLQAQWMLDPSIDLVGELRRLAETLMEERLRRGQPLGVLARSREGRAV